MADVEEVEVTVDSKIEEVQNWLKTEGYEKYKEAKRLSEEESKNDPESEPYKSKYAAREVLTELKEKLETFENEDEESSEYIKLLSASIIHQLALNYSDTQEPSDGEKYFQRCLKLIQCKDERLDLNLKTVSLTLHCLNQLGILWSQRGDADKALEFLQDGELLYHRFKKDVGGAPYSIHDSCSKLSGLNFVILSPACASVVFAEVQEKDIYEPVLEEDGEFERQRKEKIPRTKADIARCWAKYCLNLIKEGKEMEEETQVMESEGRETTSTNDEENEDKNPLSFKSLEVTFYEQSVPDQVIQNFDEARIIFREGQKWLNQAKEYYLLDGHVSDFVQIQQDVSQFYKLVAFFEDDKDRKCKMHKRRVDLLSDVLCELNAQHYLQICRQLMFEIAESYSEMVDLKTALMNEQSDTPATTHAVKKVNHLINQSIKFFQTFIDSMKHKSVLPDTYDDDIVRPALVSHFCIARLYSKYLCLDTRARLDNLQKSVDVYNYIVNYCDAHPDMPQDAFQDELQISRDMAALFTNQDV
ncbi:hypothetical protein QZH41_008848 [Actinostola sp. cb2023]|nr:hypothetical protein QZH41_008848 [Actinostola sp. cb2023]